MELSGSTSTTFTSQPEICVPGTSEHSSRYPLLLLLTLWKSSLFWVIVHSCGVPLKVGDKTNWQLIAKVSSLFCGKRAREIPNSIRLEDYRRSCTKSTQPNCVPDILTLGTSLPNSTGCQFHIEQTSASSRGKFLRHWP